MAANARPYPHWGFLYNADMGFWKKIKKQISWKNVERLAKREVKVFRRKYELTGDSTLDELTAAFVSELGEIEDELTTLKGQVKLLLDERNN